MSAVKLNKQPLEPGWRAAGPRQRWSGQSKQHLLQWVTWQSSGPALPTRHWVVVPDVLGQLQASTSPPTSMQAQRAACGARRAGGAAFRGAARAAGCAGGARRLPRPAGGRPKQRADRTGGVPAQAGGGGGAAGGGRGGAEGAAGEIQVRIGKTGVERCWLVWNFTQGLCGLQVNVWRAAARGCDAGCAYLFVCPGRHAQV